MDTVRLLLKNKSPDVWAVAPDSSVFNALEIMADKNVGALPVVDDGKLVGIFSERDYARKVILVGRSSKTTRVKELMTSKVFHVKPQRSIADCMHLMTSRHIRHLPVLDHGKLVGIVTIGDVVKNLLSHQKRTIEDLETYITGGYGSRI